MSKIKAAVFASGTGSNFEAIMKHADLPCEITLLVCDKPQAPVIGKAEAFGVETFIFDTKQFNSRSEYEAEIVKNLKDQDIAWIFLAGYMRLIGKTLLQAYEGRIINIHPSLLPLYPGLDAIGQALTAGALETGVTVHFVDEGMDTGPIIAQEKVIVREGDNQERLKKRIQEAEHRLYPEVIKQLLKGEG